MALTFYNTMGRKLQEFTPITPGKAGFYGCGPTVYNYAHIGNMRPYVFQDILKKTLRYLGYDVTHVMNITDIGHLSGDADDGEDKMVKTAKERGQSVLDIAQFYTDAFFRDTDLLNIERPTVVCKATDHISDMIELNKRLEANGHTYMAGGNLYFDVATFPEYGKLAQIQLEDLKAGARIEVDTNKRNPHDFVLWFTKSKFENQALTWDSPWGRGYPGWHVECSAMSMKYLGEQFDIHTGGIDHIQIHHTNEIAQSEGATGKRWVNYWLHNEFLVIDKGKMSKSGGSFLTLQSILDKGYDALDYRFFLIGAHYRSQLAFSWESMESAKNARKSLLKQIAKILDALEKPAAGSADAGSDTAGSAAAGSAGAGTEPGALAHQAVTADVAEKLFASSPAAPYLERFRSHIEQDLNTARALSELQGAARDTALPAADALEAIRIMDSVLGIDLERSARELREQEEPAAESDPRIDALIQERTAAKKAKNFARADEIRNLLRDEGIILEDSATGTIWKRINSGSNT
ncbi:MAG TPA: cysteine--tRNA ligase [Treponemataceae bacterium]|nr:cysteine--tRNA ligase [Treponemataceae bacterium]